MSTVNPDIRVNNRIIGQSVENALDQLVHPAYLRASLLADVWHEGQRAIWTRGGLKPVDSRPDYGGLLPGGRYFCLDAKHCQERRYRHPKERLHQLSALWKAHNADGLAGILVVNWKVERAWWLLPEPEWEYEQFTSTLLEPGIAVVEVQAHPDFGEFLPDWLAATKGIR